jgi:hypothetical protein
VTVALPVSLRVWVQAISNVKFRRTSLYLWHASVYTLTAFIGALGTIFASSWSLTLIRFARAACDTSVGPAARLSVSGAGLDGGGGVDVSW